MRRTLLAVMICLAAAETASAGAWLRETGTGFASASVDYTATGTGTGGLYLEYGWREALTIGVDVSIDLDPEQQGSSTAGLFLRRPLGRTDGTTRWAWQTGGGVAWDDMVVQPFVSAGLSWGRGLQIGTHYGWAAVDGTLKWETLTGGQIVKLDSTVGFGLTDRTKAMLQLFLENDEGNMTTKLAPSLLYQPGAAKASTIQFGIVIPGPGSGDPALKLGLWREF